MQTDRRTFAADADRHALNLLRSGRWVRIVRPAREDDDYEILSVAPAGAAPGDEQGRG